MKKIIAITLISSILFVNAKAQQQGENITSVGYSMGLGVGNTHDFISKYSWRGFFFDYRKMATDNVGVGLNLGWNTFYQEMPYQTYHYQSVDATGYQFRYLNSFPMIANIDYFARPGEKVNPYLGAGLGVQYIIQTADFGIYRFESDGWPFTINPEVGTIIHTYGGVDFNVGIKFMYAVKSSDLNAQSQLLFNLGFAFGE